MPPRSCSVEVKDVQPAKGEGRIRRHYKSPDKLLTVPEECVDLEAASSPPSPQSHLTSLR
jgi:hypothetical protein